MEMAKQRRSKSGQFLTKSKQTAHHGGGFHSEKQRRFIWAVDKPLAHKIAHNGKPTKAEWAVLEKIKPIKR
jgi:hypothetical protein